MDMFIAQLCEKLYQGHQKQGWKGVGHSFYSLATTYNAEMFSEVPTPTVLEQLRHIFSVTTYKIVISFKLPVCNFVIILAEP